MDPLADKILISAALCVFAYLGYIYWWMVIVIVVRDFFITFLRLFALHLGKSIVTSYFAKWKTMVQMTAVIVLIIYLNFPNADIYQLDSLPPSYTHWTSLTFLVVTVLTFATGIQYLIENRGHLVELVRRALKLHN